MDKLDGMSMDLEQEARGRLQSLFPDCFVEGKLDIDKLLTMCGEYITNDFEKYKFEWKGKADASSLLKNGQRGRCAPVRRKAWTLTPHKTCTLRAITLRF